jgi:hypothetical protein
MPDRLDLEDELVALGRMLVIDPPRDDLADLVLARLGHPEDATPDAMPHEQPDEQTDEQPAAPVVIGLPGTRMVRPGRRRLGWAVAAAVVLVLALIPPVRAAVVELLRIGGVVVREEPRPSTSPAAPATQSGTATGAPTGTAVSVARAEQLIGADIAVPAALGPPTSVVVTHEGRVAELVWHDATGTTRLDVFLGSLSWGYLKTVWDAVTPVEVAGYHGVWLGAPHVVEWIDREGGTHSEPARLAGPTLIWVAPAPAGEVTYRLEGRPELADAVRVAQSAR